ncbi:hypothetical protein [Pectobacterium phage PPWS2]|uniref:Uncharacterized protein n=1 Tax=Pectobacterium phage PPWS2 TaxID=2153295 RepID=A0A3G9E9R2_9CAUD|nr:endonuclease [Pectobacterium phage PPWS2]BBD74670.1 hypothetical protein [Pectobacterium phage PPWS2]
MESKQCSACNQLLSIDHFSKSGRSENTFRGAPKAQRYSSRCKSCASEYAKEWRQRNPDYKKPNRNRNPEQQLLYSFIRSRLSDAKARSDNVTVTFDELLASWTGYCSISGLPINMTKGSLDVGSLDQIVAGAGYTPGNVQWVSWRVNRTKGDQTQAQFIEMCRAVLNV